MNNRISTIKAGLTAFENTAYTKKDVLTELLKLQDQMGNGLMSLKSLALSSEIEFRQRFPVLKESAWLTRAYKR